MYLSRLQLNATNRQVWRQVIGNPYKLHQLVMHGFPDEVKRNKANVLHRLDVREETAILLVQSELEPNWSQVKPEVLAPADPFDPVPNPAIKPLALPLRTGQALSFRLCANPTIKKARHDENGERLNSNRVPLLRQEQQLEWLQKRAGSSGFQVLHVTITQPDQQTAWKPGHDRPITLYTVRFDGLLRVTQPDQLLEAIKTGIGPGRAFGCGLLSVAPA